jgi:hypothetical protein
MATNPETGSQSRPSTPPPAYRQSEAPSAPPHEKAGEGLTEVQVEGEGKRKQQQQTVNAVKEESCLKSGAKCVCSSIGSLFDAIWRNKLRTALYVLAVWFIILLVVEPFWARDDNVELCRLAEAKTGEFTELSGKKEREKREYKAALMALNDRYIKRGQTDKVLSQTAFEEKLAVFNKQKDEEFDVKVEVDNLDNTCDDYSTLKLALSYPASTWTVAGLVKDIWTFCLISLLGNPEIRASQYEILAKIERRDYVGAVVLFGVMLAAVSEYIEKLGKAFGKIKKTCCGDEKDEEKKTEISADKKESESAPAAPRPKVYIDDARVERPQSLS